MNAKTTKKTINAKHGKNAAPPLDGSELSEGRALSSMLLGAAPHFIAAGIDSLDAQSRAYDAAAMKDYAEALVALSVLGGIPALDPVKTACVAELGVLARRLTARRTAPPTATTDAGEVKPS